MATSLEGSKKITSDRSSTAKVANSVKIGLVDVEIIGLTEITESK